MAANYLKGAEARQKLMNGVLAVRDAVALTYGAKGKAAVLEVMESPHSLAVDDGITIAERVKMDDSYENIGANLMKEAITRSNKESGDGSTTTCLLTAAILEEGEKQKDSPDDIRNQLFDCLSVILQAIDEQTVPITADEIGKVAYVSSQDREMSTIIQEIFQKIGKDGVVDWDNSYTTETFYEIKDGIELKNVAPAAQWMMNENVKGAVQNPYEADRASIKNPKILITHEKVSSIDQLEPYLKALSQEGKREMVLFFDEIEPLVLQALAVTFLQGKFKVVCLKAPTLWKDWVYEDFARLTGATVIGTNGATWKNPSLTFLGTCERLTAYRHGTNIIGTKDITEHIKTIEEGAKKFPDLAARAAWLNSKSAIIRIGARSEIELTHKRYKMEDAVNSAKMALQNGVVLGAGISLVNAAMKLPQTTGGKILNNALRAPYFQLIDNGNEVDEEKLKELGVYDAANIPKNAISSAISVAATVLNCDTVIPLDRTDTKYA